MTGSKAGAKKAVATIKEKYGPDFYRNIGRIGGRNSTTGGFYHRKYVQKDIEFVKESGAVGGRISRRGKKKEQEKQVQAQ